MVSEEPNSEIELASEVIPVPQVLPEVQNISNEDMVHISNEAENVNNEEDSSHKAKNPRHRKKALCAAILKQMEFYFGDSNLTKDRYLAGLIKENPDIDIEIFLRFNRIKTLTTDINLIAKALKKSSMLQVSEDGTKVCRVTPIVEKQNIDECSVYIQGLPSDADHEWLIKLFSEYGPVAYVSIPKFKYNNKIKGFAFIEFETPDAAEKCLKAFRAKGCELPCQTSPTEVLSITTFNEEENQDNASTVNTKKYKENQNKRAREDEESLESAESKSKKKKKNKSSKPNDLKESETNDSECSKSKLKQDKSEEKHVQSGADSDGDRENNEEKLKTRKRKRKSLEHKDSEDEQPENPQLKQILKRTESTADTSSCLSDTNVEGEEKRGKKRKNRTSHEGTQESESELQSTNKRKKVKSGDATSEQENTESEINAKKENTDEPVECESKEGAEKKKKKKRKRNRHPHEVVKATNLGMQVMGKKSWKKLRNKYLELQRAKMKQLKQHMRNARWNQWGEKNKMEYEDETTVNKKENSASNLEFTSGVIVKVELNQACVDPKGFKAEMRNHSGKIKYVDIKEGSNVAFVRCESSEAANTLAEETSDDRCFKVLKDEEEKSYWEKIAMDRKEKIENKIRPKHRGRDKLLKKAEKELGKHIKFDEV